jgi:hypothetical protein
MAYESSAELEQSDSDANEDVNQGLRLVKSFRRIKNPAHRQQLLELAEELALQAQDE